MTLQRFSLLILVGALAAPGTAYAVLGTEKAPKDADVVEDKQPEVLKVGSIVPETLTLDDFEGRSTSFKELRDKVVIVHFWSYRCPAERHANPIFKEMQTRYASGKDVVMVGIVSNQNELGAPPAKRADYSKLYTQLREKRDEVGYTHTILADHGNVVSDLFQARTTPHCFVIDKQGVVQYSGALDDDPRGKKGRGATNYVVEAVAAVLAEEKLPVTETKPYG